MLTTIIKSFDTFVFTATTSSFIIQEKDYISEILFCKILKFRFSGPIHGAKSTKSIPICTTRKY